MPVRPPQRRRQPRRSRTPMPNQIRCCYGPMARPARWATIRPIVPRLTLFRARQPSGAAIIVAPGGGYSALASNHEGRQVANLLNAAGITTFVLKYRLGPDTTTRSSSATRSAPSASCAPAPRSSEWRPTGSASWASRRVDTWPRPQARISMPASPSAPDAIDRVSSRPDFLILGYPVISFDPTISHKGSVRNLLGDNPDPKLMEDLSNELRVTADTPPTFLFHTNADTGVGREQRPLLSGAAARQGSGGAAHLRERSARRRPGARRSRAVTVAHAPDQLAPGAGDDQVMLNVEC